jgi:hypothetical protein
MTLFEAPLTQGTTPDFCTRVRARACVHGAWQAIGPPS